VMFPEDYPTEPHCQRDHAERELQCPACGTCWHADGHEEHGWWEPGTEEDAYCPECGVEGEA
jgi:hypothetical protein